MTTGRLLALLIGTPLALAIIGWAGVTAVAYAGQGSYPVHLDIPVHGRTVTVSVDSGNMRVTQAAGDRLQVTGTAHYSLVRSTVTRHTTPSGVTVSSQCHFVTGVCSFDYQVAVPAGSPAFLSDGSGDLTLRGLSGPVNLQNQEGDIIGTALSGPRVVIGNQSGDIIISGLASARVTASDASGNITLTFTKVPDRVQVSDQSGNIKLVLPRGRTLYRVNASTSSGNRVVNVPTSLVSTHVITVTNQSGDITITD
jgi:hypothetical protein